MEHKIIDNFLEKEKFDSLTNIVFSEYFPYYFQENINDLYINADKDNHFYLTHILYNHNKNNSSSFDNFYFLLDKINAKSLIRMKINCYPKTHKLEIHKSHLDYDFKHKGCILYFNDCDGYTILKDGTKIESIANRALFFDPSLVHSSTSCTDKKARFNININYF